MIYMDFQTAHNQVTLMSISTFVDTDYLQLKLFPLLEIPVRKFNDQTRECLMHKIPKNLHSEEIGFNPSP